MKIILCFSHKLNDIQLLELKNRYNISNSKDIIYLPQDLQFIWSNVSENFDIYSNNYNKIKNFIKATANENDLILIKGEWGYTYNLVTYCKKHPLNLS
ncbi:CRISPR-associated protein Csx20 [Sneathia sanguinegens]|uniref:CRISPR-associated protein Csx20 n=1 Tax=Sneathia sanguinegens TaxID=40543 RepID=UPI00290D19A4|nr:CRISPR-associated protein Csx20 [Sneathia sanguinegens]MDU7496966.1 CRISPR-associated protein Csx20 [Sneathia sanguinegens]